MGAIFEVVAQEWIYLKLIKPRGINTLSHNFSMQKYLCLLYDKMLVCDTFRDNHDNRTSGKIKICRSGNSF